MRLLIRIFPAWLVTGYLALHMSAIYIYKTLLGTLTGLLLVAICSYIAVEHFSQVEPFGAKEFALWLQALPVAFKASMLTASITVIGFLFAFYSGSYANAQQSRQKLSLQAKNDLAEFLMRCASATQEAGATAMAIRKSLNELRSTEEVRMCIFHAKQIARYSSRLEKAREDLLSCSKHAVVVFFRYQEILSTFIAMADARQWVQESLEKIIDKSWIVIPEIDPEQEADRAFLAKQLDPNSLDELAASCDKHGPVFYGVAGGLGGVLVSSIIDYSFGKWVSDMRSLKRTYYGLKHLRDKDDQ